MSEVPGSWGLSRGWGKFGNMAGPEPSRSPDMPLLRWSDIALIGIAASFSPLSVMAAHSAVIVHPERIVALIVLVWLVASLVTAFLIKWVWSKHPQSLLRFWRLSCS